MRRKRIKASVNCTDGIRLLSNNARRALLNFYCESRVHLNENGSVVQCIRWSAIQPKLDSRVDLAGAKDSKIESLQRMCIGPIAQMRDSQQKFSNVRLT